MDLLAERYAQRGRQAAARAEALRIKLPRARDLLRERGATRVFAFGSLVHGPVHLHSDVDLAVEGLTITTAAAARLDLERMFDAQVDLVCLETASDTLRARVEAEGEAL